MGINEAIASATVSHVHDYYRAEYAPHGPAGAAAYGWGASESAALGHLADVLNFNVEHNGFPV